MIAVGVLDEVAPFDDPDDYDPHGYEIDRDDRELMREWDAEKRERSPLEAVPLKRMGRRGLP